MMKFRTCTLYAIEVGYDEYRERKEILKRVKDISINIVTRTINDLDTGFKGNYPRLNGFTLEKNIAKGQVIESEGVRYRVIYVDPVPRLTTLYLEYL